MKKFTLVAALVLGLAYLARPLDRMKVEWLTSLDAAKAKAAETGKPILHFQLLGRLDEEYC